MFQTTVDCLDNGSPHADAARHFLDVVAMLPEGRESFSARSMLTWELFQRSEALQARDDFTMAQFSDLLVEIADRTLASWKSQQEFLGKLDFSRDQAAGEDFQDATRSHYGRLFSRFSEFHYYEEAAALLATRLERNGIELPGIAGQRALDAGCGGGRYTHALGRLGFGRVDGVDFSPLNIETATSRRDAKGIDGIEFRVGNVLELPFEDAAFDFVFSNGVLHHTESIPRGLAEIRRVLKPGGLAWLYVIERPGGVHWDMVELLRNVMRPVERDFAQSLFALLGVPGNRIFYILDHIMVPINTRTTPAEIESLARDAGLEVRCRLERGTDFDRAEQIFQRRQNGLAADIEWKFGVGENRYMLARR